MENNCYPFVNTPLPYAYDALEPFIDARTMHIHHDKHLETYVGNLNAALADQPELQGRTLTELIQTAGKLPQPLQNAVRNNAGGVFNHRFYFDSMVNPAPTPPRGALAQAIEQCFGGFAQFSEAFRKAGLAVFGSGYAWLVYDGPGLRIVTTPNQDNPLAHGLRPLLCLDVWEHAYYLKHQNVRAAYIGDWMQVVNWDKVGERYEQCRGRA